MNKLKLSNPNKPSNIAYSSILDPTVTLSFEFLSKLYNNLETGYKPSNLILEKWVDCQLGSLTAGVIVEKGRDDCPWGCLGLQDKGEEGDP
ncbi:hypothetical protein Tco_1243981 [Tanacetum coccineum]